MEIFLYMCEVCGACMFDKQDRGSVSYANYCVGCKQGSFFKKVVIRHTFDEYYTQIYQFVLEEKKDDSKKEE